jgi:hypothetical protein
VMASVSFGDAATLSAMILMSLLKGFIIGRKIIAPMMFNVR